MFSPSISRPSILAVCIALSLSQIALAKDADKKTKEKLETIEVTGQQTSALQAVNDAGALGSRLIIDTPFSVATISSEEMQARQVNSLETLFGRDASVNVLGGTYSGFGSNISVRGLSLDYTNSFKVNGLSVNSFSGELPYEVFEQVDLLKGATGFMYGFAAPGGVVNYTTKKARQELVSIDAGYRSSSIMSAHIDAGTRFGTQDQAGIRVNLGHENGDTFNDGGKVDRSTAALAFETRITDNLLWTLDLIYNSRLAENSVSYLNNRMDSSEPLPQPVSGSRNLGVKGSFNDHVNLIGQTSLFVDLNDNWKARFDYGYAKNDTRWVKTMPDLLNSEGDISLRVYDQYFDVDFDQLQASIEGIFYTGDIKHQLITGVSNQKTTTWRNDPNRVVKTLEQQDNLYNPVSIAYRTTLQEDLSKMWSTEQQSAYINDSIEFSPNWNLLIGARYTNYDYQILADIYKSRLQPYEDSAVTPTVALLFKPQADTTYYISYVEAFEEGSTVSETYENANEVLPPLKSKQYEAGIKMDRENWNATAALFRIERAAEYGDTNNVYVQDGVTLYQGLELSALYQVSQQFTVDGNIMLLDASYDKTEPGSTITNNDVAGAPDFQAGLHGRYAFDALPGLTLDFGAKYFGEQALDAGNVWTLSSYTLFDAGVAYNTQFNGKNVTFRAAASNLTDKEYWATEGFGGLRIGEPRSVSLSVKVDM